MPLRRTSLLYVMLFALAVACHGESGASGGTRRPPGGDVATLSTDAWEREVARSLALGDCRAAMRTLNGTRERLPLWFELMSQSHVECWRREHSDADRAAAIGVLDAGLRSFPTSANLMLSKGYRYKEFGDTTAALAAFNAAVTQARNNIAAAAQASQSRPEDRAALDAASSAIASIEPGRKDERLFEQEVLKRMLAGDCEGAVTELAALQVAKRTDVWFDLAFVVNSYCFTRSTKPTYESAAREALKEGLRAFPSSARLLVHAAASREAAGGIAEAIDLYKRALESPGIEEAFEGGRAAVKVRIEKLQAEHAKRGS